MGVESGISEDIGDKSSCEPTRALVSFKHDIHFGTYSDVVPVFPVHDSLLPLVLFCLFSGEHRPFRFQSFFVLWEWVFFILPTPVLLFAIMTDYISYFPDLSPFIFLFTMPTMPKTAAASPIACAPGLSSYPPNTTRVAPSSIAMIKTLVFTFDFIL